MLCCLARALTNCGCHRAGFEWRHSYKIQGAPTGDQTWTDLLIYLVKHYDVVAEWFYHTVARMELGVSFPEGALDLLARGVHGDTAAIPLHVTRTHTYSRAGQAGTMQASSWWPNRRKSFHRFQKRCFRGQSLSGTHLSQVFWQRCRVRPR